MSTGTPAGDDRLQTTGWARFASIWLIIAGSFGVVEGITAIHSGDFYANSFLFSDVGTWGWIILIAGAVQVVAGFMVFAGNPTGYTLGILISMLIVFFWFFFLFAAATAALIAVILNGLVIYGLTIGSDSDPR